MPSISNHDLSLYQLIKNSDPPPSSIGVSSQTLQSYVENLINVLSDLQIKTTIILKSPQSYNWFDLIDNYQIKGNLETLYICRNYSESQKKASTRDTVSTTKIVDLDLAENSLKKECFLFVLTSDFCALLLAQWQKGKIKVDVSGKRLQQPYLETIINFNPSIIKKCLLEIEKELVSSYPEISLVLADFNSYIYTNQTTFFTNLLIEQIIKEDNSFASTYSSFSPNTTSETASLAQTLGLKSDFLRSLVDEMRSPITHMKTTISLLESKQIKGEQRQRYFQMLEEQCDRQNSVINGLLELLQLDISTEADTIYLNEFVPGIVSTYQPLANENNIQLGYTIPANLPPVIFPASWLRQIVIQLLNNSLQFTPPQGRVFVQATPKDMSVELAIGDTGRGIETQELNKIFDSFYRTKTASNDRNAGAGLGLTIVRQLVEKSGGKVSVTSKIGKGSSFKILLPALPIELL